MKIKSLQNSRVKHLTRLHQKKYRDQHNEVLVEGGHLLEELDKSGLDYISIGLDESFDWVITREIAQKISQTTSGSEVFALLKKPQLSPKKREKILILDRLQDPGNVGTIIRTAYSFGFDLVYASEDSADAWNDKAIRASQGAVFHLPYYRENLKTLIPKLQKDGIKVYATNLSNESVSLENLKAESLAVVLGSEGQGVSPEILKLSDEFLKIPMTHFESLNVAVAAGIICYHLQKG